jgi:hypothetical protein
MPKKLQKRHHAQRQYNTPLSEIDDTAIKNIPTDIFRVLQYLPPLPTVVAIIGVRAKARRPLWNETSLLL